MLHSAALGWDVGYVVWKPANYDPTRKYPVIYFLLINGEKDSPKAFQVLVKTFAAAGVEHSVVIPTPTWSTTSGCITSYPLKH